MHINFKLQIFHPILSKNIRKRNYDIQYGKPIYIYIHPSPPPPLCTCKYANIRFRIFGKLREESLPYKTKNQLKILSALTVHARCNTVPELINRDSRRTKTGLIKLSIYFLYIVQP